MSGKSISLNDLDETAEAPDALAMERQEAVTAPRSYPLKTKPSRLAQAAQIPVDMMYTGLDVATGGLTRPVAGAINVGVGALSDPMSVDADMVSERWNEGWEGAAEMFDPRRERLPWAPELLSELAGGFKGIPGIADDLVAKGTSKLAPKLLDKVRNYMATTAAGIPVNVADHYFRGDMPIEEAAQAGLFDSVMGTTMQVAVGDQVLPKMSKAWRWLRGPTPAGNAMDEISSGSLSGDQMDLASMWRLAQNLPAGQTLTEIGSPSRQAETTRRFYNGLAKLDFGSEEITKTNSRAFLKKKKVYDETVGKVRQLAEDANKEASDTMLNIIGEGGVKPPQIETSNGKAAREIFDGLGRQTPKEGSTDIPIGATPVNANEIVHGAEEKLGKELGVPLKDLGKTEKRVWNYYKDLLRGQEVETVARGVDLIDSAGKDAPQAADIFPEDLPLQRLYRARQEMAALLRPTANMDNMPLNGLQRKTVTTLMRDLDDQIEKKVTEKYGNDAYGFARGAFAEEMRVKEAKDLGADFYSGRMTEVGDRVNYQSHYGETFDEVFDGMSKREQDAFREGFKGAMADNIGQRSFLAEMKYFAGNTGDNNVLTAKSGNIKQLEKVLGKEQTEQLMDLYNNGTHVIEFRNKLGDLLDQKGISPKEKADLMGYDMTPQQVLDPNEGWISATMSFLRKGVKPSDIKKVDALEKLLKASDEDLAKLMKKGITDLAPGRARQIGVRGGALINAGDDENDEAVSDYELSEEIDAYLKAIEGQEEN